jgi:hypothetical protein
MPYVEGESLRDLLTREDQLPIDVSATNRTCSSELAGSLPRGRL